MSQQGVKETVAQMLLILNNIDQMLADANDALLKREFTELHSGLQCDVSKNMATGIFPYQLSRYYRPEADETGRADTLGVGVILSNRDQAVEPVLVGGVFRPRDASTRYIAWWLFAAEMEERLSEFSLPNAAHLPMAVRARKGYDRSKANYWFDQAVTFHMPLTKIQTPEELEERFIKPLCDLYELISPS